jgi:hypothetical protein
MMIAADLRHEPRARWMVRYSVGVSYLHRRGEAEGRPDGGAVIRNQM